MYRRCSFVLLLLLLPIVSRAATCNWRWDPVAANTDGTPATLDLAGYRLYADTVMRQDVPVDTLPNPALPAITLPCAQAEVWHVTAYDTAVPANESEPSNMVIVPDLTGTSAPVGFRLGWIGVVLRWFAR